MTHDCRPRILLAALASLLIVSAARAGEVRGVVTAVDANKNELRVEGRGPARGATRVFVLDDKTLVLFGSEKASAADLQPGRHVRVEFQEDRDGNRLARVVHASGRRPAPATAAPGPAPATPAADVVSGVLQRVSRADREIVVIGPGPKGPETETTLAVPESTKVVREGNSASLEALKEGDAVVVRVEKRDGKSTAVEVQAGPGATLSANSQPSERSKAIPRLRQVLHIADEVLRRLDPEGGEPKKP
jgi:cold shock CspA family protein